MRKPTVLAMVVFGPGRRLATVAVFGALLLAGPDLGLAASSQRPSGVSPPSKSAAAGAMAFSRVMPRGGSLAVPALERLMRRESIDVLSDLVRFFTDNETKILSENQPKLLSENRPSLLNGNTVKLFSDVSILSGINVNVNVRIERSGNKRVNSDGTSDADEVFERLDLDGDGKVSAEEFRAGLSP
ncbi:MAG: hypothetical protein GX621_18695 [Pirellulaceae bacterium]|nr:hypothetical protein [Pirellulaceae bacterium]